MSAWIHIPTSALGFLFSTSSPTFLTSCFSRLAIPRREVIAHCCFWSAFLWWLMMLRVFSYTYSTSVCLLWKNVYSDRLPIFNSDCLIFGHWAAWAFYIFCILAIHQYMVCKYLLSFSGLPFHFVDGFLFCAEKYDIVPIISVFVALTFGIRFKTSSPRPMSGRLPFF